MNAKQAMKTLGMDLDEYLEFVTNRKSNTNSKKSFVIDQTKRLGYDKFGYPITQLSLREDQKKNLKHWAGSITANNNQMPTESLNETAFMLDCNLLSPIINTLVRPNGSTLMNVIPINSSLQVRDNAIKTGFRVRHTLTQSGVAPVDVCEPGFQVTTSDDLCSIQWRIGRWAKRTETGELADLVSEACNNPNTVRTDFYFVGNDGFSALRGMGDMPPALQPLRDNDFIYAAGIRKQFADLGEQYQRDFAQNFWYGDPTNNTAGGGDTYFWGLDYLIRNTWGTDGVGTPGADLNCSTGTQADASVLNSFVWDGDTDVEGETEAIIGENFSIYTVLTEWESNHRARAEHMGLQDNGVLVMPRVLWLAITKAWPLEKIEYANLPIQFTTGVNANLNAGGLAPSLITEVQNLQRSGALEINGTMYPVFIDDNINIVREADIVSINTYISTMYYIPLTVNGINALEMGHFDYSKIGTEFEMESPLSWQSVFNGWSDGGRYLLTVRNKQTCFEVDTVVKPTLMFHFPHLAARFDNLKAKLTVDYTAYAEGAALNYTQNP